MSTIVRKYLIYCNAFSSW
uniref:Uncharacterized protein n=1 Tax=Arundo donax TaxID=35708 RepID=A0A0A9FJ74_ARUDO